MTCISEITASAASRMELVDGIEPYKGYTLLRGEEEDSDGFDYPFWRATGPTGEHDLKVSRFNFIPTQARFNWLVDWGFPSAHVIGGKGGPLTDTMIDAVLAGERDCCGAELRELVAGQKAFERQFGESR